MQKDAQKGPKRAFYGISGVETQHRCNRFMAVAFHNWLIYMAPAAQFHSYTAAGGRGWGAVVFLVNKKPGENNQRVIGSRVGVEDHVFPVCRKKWKLNARAEKRRRVSESASQQVGESASRRGSALESSGLLIAGILLLFCHLRAR